ncbi:DEAD/DEAH box helicase family protein [Streptomyces goshikiensis]|uniref:helicase associated domain-containing protein n=1 Tax=Streptomyces TaxID=1883 RepID=UPI000C26EB1D|nr:helicase associated domain-containing protein [Streptomyces sp. CB02120-2]PJN14579.1 hypothetical protein CG724_33360 [Streptomyces sp. CB02120-2]
MTDTRTAPPPLRPHQSEALARAVEELTPRSPSEPPAAGLRTQVIMATGSGKTLVAVRAAEQIGGDRVLVLVPSLDLLDQTARAWRDGGRAGAFVGVSSLDSHETGFPHTTDPHTLVRLTAGHDSVTVFATYASLDNGILETAHEVGLTLWGLIVVDEAQRTSGRAGKPWAVVHDNTRIPAAARLYMTATPRIWTAGDGDEGSEELVASMTDDPDGPFGRVAYRLPLDAAMLATGQDSDTVRGPRLGALQAAALKAAEEEGFAGSSGSPIVTSAPAARSRPVPASSSRTARTSAAGLPRSARDSGRCQRSSRRCSPRSGITPAPAPAERIREEMWAHNLRAAAQYRDRVGNLCVPRSHTEEVDGEAERLGAWISQQRVRAGKHSVQRVEELSALGMRWS